MAKCSTMKKSHIAQGSQMMIILSAMVLCLHDSLESNLALRQLVPHFSSIGHICPIDCILTGTNMLVVVQSNILFTGLSE